MAQKFLPIAAALLTAALAFGQRATTADYPSENHSASDVVRAGQLQDCGIGAHCDALVPYRESGPWTASCSWFGGNPQHPANRGESINLLGSDPGQWQGDAEDWCLPRDSDANQLQFVVVSVPDPVTTHLALYFDRTIEAVEAAAGQYELYLSRYWLPWRLPGALTGGGTSESLRVNEILGDLRSAQPGILIFNSSAKKATRSEPARPARTVFVLLVGESPTAGLSKSQFKHAVQYAHSLCAYAGSKSCPNPALHVVGPFFSGSVPGLIDLKPYLETQLRNFDFVSGSLSSSKQGQLLLDKGFDFEDTLRGDESAQQFLLDFLQKRRLTQAGHNVAILEEGETRFGDFNDFSRPKPPELKSQQPRSGPLYIKFPRELSRLRNASADSVGQPVVSKSQELVPPPEGVAWNWRDVGKGEDRVPAFSGGQEPLSLQAELSSIANLIEREKIDYVGIVATDIYDLLFLSKFLKMTTPNIRIFLLSSDLLMVNIDGDGRELDGTLAVTTYPLIPRSDEWLSSSAASRATPGSTQVTFPSLLAQGMYHAVCLQLERGAPWKGEPGCAPPAARSSHITDQEPLWLTMVGHNGFWPVSLDIPSGSHGQRQSDPPEVTTDLFASLLLLWGVVHLIGVCSHSPTEASLLAQFRTRDKTDATTHAEHQSYYLMCTLLALSGMLVLLETTATCAWLREGIILRHPLLWGLLEIGKGLVALMLLGAAAKVMLRPWKYIHGALWCMPWLVYFLTAGEWIHLCVRTDLDSVFFLERAFHLSSGASPLLPLEFLLLIYYAWAWTFIRKVRLSESKQVQVPDMSLMGAVGDGLKNECALLVSATDGLIFNARVERWMAVGFIAAVALLIHPCQSLRSVEGIAYDRYFIGVFLWICLLIVLVWGRYMYIWARMRRILRGLERTPLRRAFSRLPECLYSWSPLWYEDAERRAYTISARSLECFQAIAQGGRYGPGAMQRLREMEQAFRDVVCCEGNPKKQGEAVRQLQGLFLLGADTLLELSLAGRWARQGGSDTLDAQDKKRDDKSDLMSAGAKLDLLEEEFVALRYVGLIHYESAQLKNIVVLLIAAFVLALLSIGSYPFLGGRLMVWSMGAVFVLFGAGIFASFAQMARDAILSRLGGTDAGKLDLSFFLRVLSYGAVPLLALLASQFPTLGRALVSWLQPALSALH